MPEQESKSERPTRHPSPLSTEYHKAHKQVMLWAAILFIWELVGVDLSKAEKAGGNVGPIVTALKSPQAVPWVLLALVIYFLIKCSIEWGQCPPDRRQIRFARIDFISAWVVAVAAIALYLGQAISRVQLADRLLQSFAFGSFFVGAVAAIFPTISITELWRTYRLHGRPRAGIIDLIFCSAGPAIVLVAYLIVRWTGHRLTWRFCLFGVMTGAVFAFIRSFLDEKANRPKRVAVP